MNIRRASNLSLLAVSAAGLIGGLAAWVSGRPRWAEAIWIISAAPVLLTVAGGIVRAALRREAGLDLIALLSIGGAIALGEYLTGAVIGLMLASGRSSKISPSNGLAAKCRRSSAGLLAWRTATRALR